MNEEKARTLLSAFRPGGQDAADPVFADALRQAEQDPDLARWLTAEREFDRAMQKKLADVPVPSGLLDDILAIPAVTRAPSFWRRQRGALALAASLLLLVGGLWAASGLFAPPLSFEAFPRVAAGHVSRPFRLEHASLSLEAAERWSRLRLRDGLPESLLAAAERGIGCRSFNWRGESIYLFCFSLEDGELAHFFVMDAGALPDAAPDGALQFGVHGNWNTARWADERHAYVLASEVDMDSVRALL